MSFKGDLDEYGSYSSRRISRQIEHDEAVAEIEEAARYSCPLDIAVTLIGEHDADPFGSASYEICASDYLRGLMLTNVEMFAELSFEILKRHCAAAEKRAKA